ncbi:MAG: FAD-binding protein, partial [Deltaproteobacteria bacterium]|nr:FAD-binding protein [Deltaproteobacteria bacterium]
MKSLSIEEFDTDVLVIGAGAGGMMAAISAADEGAAVILCEKGNARRSGGIFAGNDHFFCFIPEIHGADARENFVNSIMSGGMIDADIACRYVDKARDVLGKWEEWGINLKTNGHYEFTGHGWPGSSGKMGEPGKTDRGHIHFSDPEICPKLEQQVRKRGVRIINRVMMTELLKDHDGGIIGAMGVSTREPTLFVIHAKSVILNSGAVNGTRLYPSPYVKGYSMAEPGTGDGEVMAYRAGADIQNAEMCYLQTGLRFGPWAGRGTWVGILRDAEGKPVGPPYLSAPDPEIGDMSVESPDAIDHALATGRGPVWMDPRGISLEDEKYMRWGFESEAMHAFVNWVDSEKIDFKSTRFEFTVFQPRPNICIRVKADFQTSLDGLYAIMRRGLPKSAVGGLVSGKAAAKYSRDIEPADNEDSQDLIQEAKRSYEAILNREG